MQIKKIKKEIFEGFDLSFYLWTVFRFIDDERRARDRPFVHVDNRVCVGHSLMCLRREIIQETSRRISLVTASFRTWKRSRNRFRICMFTAWRQRARSMGLGGGTDAASQHYRHRQKASHIHFNGSFSKIKGRRGEESER